MERAYYTMAEACATIFGKSSASEKRKMERKDMIKSLATHWLERLDASPKVSGEMDAESQIAFGPAPAL